jgi:hypothetical protein
VHLDNQILVEINKLLFWGQFFEECVELPDSPFNTVSDHWTIVDNYYHNHIMCIGYMQFMNQLTK